MKTFQRKCLIGLITVSFLLLSMLALHRIIRKETLTHRLGAAVYAGKTGDVKRLLNMGADPNGWYDPGSLNDSFLDHILSRIDNRLDPSEDRSAPVIYIATDNAYIDGNTDIVKLLLEHGANPDVISAKGYATLLVSEEEIGGIDWKLVKLLLDHGANPNIQNSSLLGHAVYERKIEWVRYLLDHGADINQEKGVLVTAADNLDVSMVKLLLEHGADTEVRAEEPDVDETAPVTVLQAAEKHRADHPQDYEEIVRMITEARTHKKH